jgi:hypothetical protein
VEISMTTRRTLQRFGSYTNIDLVVRIPVSFDADSPITSLAGAEVDARARSSGGIVIVGQAVVDTDNTTIIATFPRGTLPPGVCECQVWARVGAQAAMPFVFEAEVRPGLRPVE